MFNETTSKLIITGLGASVVYLTIKNRIERERSSKEKLHLFGICMALGFDVVALQNKIKEEA